jgi:tryptophan halogenase
MDNFEYKKVVIVGGGSSGWMTAAALSKLCPHLEITLIESKKIGTVGVGESTLGHINRYLNLLGLKDEDWMKACNATYKNSIRFTNFRENKGESFEYPFINGYDLTDKHNGLQSWGEVATMYPDEYPPETFAEFYAPVNTLLAKYNKETKNENGELRHYDFPTNTAYHMDAGLFGEWLKDTVALPNGVVHEVGELHSFRKDPKGNLSQVLTVDGRTFTGDLWIDCTGFRSLLLEEWMGSFFIPFENQLANDMAWACRIPYIDRDKEMHNVTDCHALDNGWVWNIPLWNRIGTGYVFSSRFCTPQEAQKEFRAHLAKTDPKRAEEAEMFQVKIKHGYRHRAWKMNVVGVGLSYGFVEPLESTGLLTTHENIIRLIDVLNRRNGYVSRVEKEAFNLAAQLEVTGFRDFVACHYALSKRTDTPYWRWYTQINDLFPLQFNDFIPAMHTASNAIAALASNHYNESTQGLAFIMAGMGIKNISTPALVTSAISSTGTSAPVRLTVDKMDAINDTKRKHEQYIEWLTECIKKLPSHYEYLRDNIYGGTDEHL